MTCSTPKHPKLERTLENNKAKSITNIQYLANIWHSLEGIGINDVCRMYYFRRKVHRFNPPDEEKVHRYPYKVKKSQLRVSNFHFLLITPFCYFLSKCLKYPFSGS
jgi:hypothetical protein